MGISDGKEALIRQLLGTPILVQRLTGVDKEVALLGYGKALKTIYLAGGILATFMVLVQAGTGWTAPEGDKDDDEVVDGADEIQRAISRESVEAA